VKSELTAANRTIAVVAYFYLLLSTAASAQDAVVTFYSHGSRATSGVPGTKNGVYWGSVFDGDERLLTFKDGFFFKNNRFTVLRLPPGTHTFSASYNSHPSKDHSFSIDLKAGENYFIRAQSESSGVIVVDVEHGRLDQVTCKVALDETAKAKPLSAKAISSKVAGNIVQQSAIPSCP
jgi:hypothetical protein